MEVIERASGRTSVSEHSRFDLMDILGQSARLVPIGMALYALLGKDGGVLGAAVITAIVMEGSSLIRRNI